MTIDILDTSYALDCTDCEDDCTVDGCQKLVTIGPCSTLLANGVWTPPASMIFDVNTWCRVLKLNSATYNPNGTIRKQGFVGECFESTKQGRKRPTIDLEYQYCKSEDSHCRLQNDGCLVAWMMMNDRADFRENVAAPSLNCIRYGMARIEAGPESAVFDEDDVRTVTLHIHERMWEYNLCGIGHTVNPKQYAFEEDKD